MNNEQASKQTKKQTNKQTNKPTNQTNKQTNQPTKPNKTKQSKNNQNKQNTQNEQNEQNKQNKGDKTNKRGVKRTLSDALHAYHAFSNSKSSESFVRSSESMSQFFPTCITRNHPHSLKFVYAEMKPTAFQMHHRNWLYIRPPDGSCRSSPMLAWRKNSPRTFRFTESFAGIASPLINRLDVCCQVQLDMFGNEQQLAEILKSESNTYCVFVHK